MSTSTKKKHPTVMDAHARSTGFKSRLVNQLLPSIYVCSRGALLARGLRSSPRIPSGFYSGLWSSIARRLKNIDFFGSLFGVRSSFVIFEHRWLQSTSKCHHEYGTRAREPFRTLQTANKHVARRNGGCLRASLDMQGRGRRGV